MSTNSNKAVPGRIAFFLLQTDIYPTLRAIFLHHFCLFVYVKAIKVFTTSNHILYDAQPITMFRPRRNIPFVILLVTLLQSTSTFAQYDAQQSQYMLVPGTYNPAAAGQNSDLNIVLLNRQQWVGIENAPKSLFAHATMPFTINNKTFGLGIDFLKETIGLFSTQIVHLQYAYKKKIKEGTISLGIQGGILQEGFDADGILIPTSDYHSKTDQSIPEGSLSGFIPDFSLGTWYDHRLFYAGLSVSHLLETKVHLKSGSSSEDDNSFRFAASRTYYLTGGYNIAFTNPLYTIQPSVLLKTDLNAWQLDLTGKLTYKNRFWGGLSWRPKDAVAIMVGTRLPQGLSVGYSYDISTSVVAKFSSGSHELFVGYTRKIETAKVSKKQKSVRIL